MYYTVTGDQPDGFTVSAGDTAEIIGLCTTPKAVIVYGTLKMRAGSELHFRDIVVANFVGGSPVNPVTDPGLIVKGTGVLDLQGTYKKPYTRGVDDPTWVATDEIRQSPTDDFDYAPNGWILHTLGAPVPKNSYNTPAMLINLTRDVKITGAPGAEAHIHITSTVPQICSNVEINYMAPQRLNASLDNFGILGRYAWHMHMASQGSILRNFVIKNAGHHSFVPHGADGAQMFDCVSYNCQNAPFWWDLPDVTNNVLWSGCVAACTQRIRNNGVGRIPGFELGEGTGNTCYNCTVIGSPIKSLDSAGASWPEGALAFWEFENFTAENLACSATFFWQNSGPRHPISSDGSMVNAVNCGAGTSHGAYKNSSNYVSHRLINCTTGIRWWAAVAGSGYRTDGYAISLEDYVVWGGQNAIILLEVVLTSPAVLPVLFRHNRFLRQRGHKIVLDQMHGEGPSAGLFDFVDCYKEGPNGTLLGIRPADVNIKSSIQGTIIRIQDTAAALAWSIDWQGTVTNIAQFYPLI